MPDKKILWASSSWESDANLGPATSIQLFDDPGSPAAMEQQR